MEHYSIDYTISLIHSWLKENKLLNTCKSLEVEYGNKIPSPGHDTSLEKIIETYQAMSWIMSAFVKLPVKKARAVNPRKRKTSTSSATTEISTTSALPSALVTETITQSTATTLPKTTGKGKKAVAKAVEAHVPTIPKKKSVPLAKPGEWVCPQMEEALCDLYDRMPGNVFPLPVGVVTAGISNAATIIKETDKVQETEVIDDKPITKTVVDAENISMFTSDSESDSDNEDNVGKPAVKKTSNIVSSPVKHVKLTETVATIQKVKKTKKVSQIPPKDDKCPDGDDSYQQKSKSKKLFPVNPHVFDGNGVIEEKKKSGSSGESKIVEVMPENSSSDAGHIKKKKKKHKINAEGDDNRKISSLNEDTLESPLVQKIIQNEEDSYSQDSGIGMASLNDNRDVTNIVKKKKKKHKSSSENDVLNQSIVSNSTVEDQDIVTEKKKKKKEKSNIVDNNFQKSVLENKEENIEDHKSAESVKKKKKKSKVDIEIPSIIETVVTQPKSVSAIDNSESLNNLGNILKKKKKKKHVDIGS